MKRQYAILIIPISIIVHLLIINIGFYFFNIDVDSKTRQLIFVNLFWLLIAYFTKIYKFHRYTKVPKIIGRLLFQYSVFTLAYLSYYAIFDLLLNTRSQVVYLGTIFGTILIFRTIYFYGLRRYRLEGYNFKNVVVIGSGKDIEPLIKFFNKRQDFGFHYKGCFNDDNTSPFYLGTVAESFAYIKNNEIDEIYCSISSLSHKKITEFIDFADDNVKSLKLIPDSKSLYNQMKLDYYGYVPVLSVRELQFDKPLIKFLKRLFDIVFSLLVIIFILSWVSPILYFIIKRETKGPLFFKQIREGVRGDSFLCYKYRSMGVNKNADKKQATKGDARVTKIGAFIRKTSIDELPQFINVLKGEMSVVGPRPHMLSQSKMFKKIVNKYMVRHFVKPGITGLAQVKGYRGEIETDADIKNRVKFDIFYIENWSFFLDVKIIIKTVRNAISGEEKAY